MKKEKVSITVKGADDNSGFIKVLLILFFVLVVWAVVAVNSDKISNFWVQSGGNSLTGNMILNWNNTNAYVSSTYLSYANTTWIVRAVGDIDGDGILDLVWQLPAGNAAVWFMNAGGTMKSSYTLYANSTTWIVRTAGDINKDGIADLIWQNTDGKVAIWFLNSSGGTKAVNDKISTAISNWIVRAVGDINKDGFADLIWQLPTGQLVTWFLNSSGGRMASTDIYTDPTTWIVKSAGDFNKDGIADLIWQLPTGQIAIWFLNSSGGQNGSSNFYPSTTPWNIVAVGDINQDNALDLIWQLPAPSGNVAAWLLRPVSYKCEESDWVSTTWSACNSTGSKLRTWSLKVPGSCSGGVQHSSTEINNSCIFSLPECQFDDWEVSNWGTCNSSGSRIITSVKVGNCQGGEDYSVPYVDNGCVPPGLQTPSDCNTSVGCYNFSIANAYNVTGNCSYYGLTSKCYLCNVGYEWDYFIEECIISTLNENWRSTHTIEPSQLSAGYTGSLSLYEAFWIIVADEDHYVGVVKLNSTAVIINVSSVTQQKMFRVGNEFKFDVNGDSLNDLKIKLNSISSTQASFTLTSIDNTVPVATCSDGVQNQGETGIDCGGPCTPCSSLPPSCLDNIRNQGETGIDCGGPCDVCSVETCSDGIPNQGETGIDCGGPCDVCSSSSNWTIWALVIMIIVIIVAIAFVYFKKFRKSGLSTNFSVVSRPGLPPTAMSPNNMTRPVFPPVGLGSSSNQSPMRPGFPPARPGMPPNNQPRPGMVRPSNIPLRPGMPPAPVRPGFPPARPQGK